jgi:hypothetical protein
VVPSWIVFEIAPTKLFHYTLPLYPALALMAGAAADRWFDTGEWNKGRWISAALFGATSLGIALLCAPGVLNMVRADGARHFGRDLRERVEWLWTQDWNATGIGIWPTLLILAVAAATLYALIKKNQAGVIAGIIACSAVAGISYRTIILPNQTWALSTSASLSALKELCALPEGTAAWQKSGCKGRAPKTIRAIAFAEPSLVFLLGDKMTIPSDVKADLTDIPAIADDNRPAWLINIADKEGRQAMNQLADNAAASDRCIRFARRFAYNYSNGDPQILVAAVVEPGGCPNSGPPPELRDTNDDQPAPELHK